MFAVNKLISGIGFEHSAGSPTIEIARDGTYYISVDADITPAATGPVTVQLYNNGAPVVDAYTNFNGSSTATQSIHFDTLVKVLPSCKAVSNVANLQVVVDVAANVNDAQIVMF